MTDKDTMNLNSKRLRPFILCIFLFGLVLVGGEIFAADQVQSTCVTNNCDSSPLSCQSAMVLTAEQLECEKLRSGEQGDYLSPEGYCACISALGAKTRGAGYMHLSHKRVNEIQDLARNTAMNDYAESYIESSRLFSDLIFMSRASGLFDHNEIVAKMIGMKFEEFKALSEEEQKAKTKEAREHIASCTGTKLYDEVRAQQENKYCSVAGPELIKRVVANEMRENDSAEGYRNFTDALKGSGISREEIDARFIEFKSTEALVNNRFAKAVIDEKYGSVFDKIRSAQSVKVSELPDIEVITQGAAVANEAEASGLFRIAMFNLTALVKGVDENGNELSTEQRQKMISVIHGISQGFPTIAEVVKSWGPKGNRSIEVGVESLVANVKEAALKMPSTDAFKILKAQIKLSQMDLLENQITSCKARENKRKMLCEAYNPQGHGVHINDIDPLNPGNAKAYADRIIAQNRVAPDDQPLLRQHLDILSCVANSPRAALCKPGAGARIDPAHPKRADRWAHLNYMTVLANDGRHSCTDGVSMSFFWPGYRDFDKGDVLNRNQDPNTPKAADGSVWGQDVADQTIKGNEPASSVVSGETTLMKPEEIAVLAQQVQNGETDGLSSSGGFFSSAESGVMRDLDKTYGASDRALASKFGIRIVGGTTRAIEKPSFSPYTASTPSASSTSDVSRSPASVASTLSNMVSSTLAKSPFATNNSNTKPVGVIQNDYSFIDEMMDNEGNLKEGFEEKTEAFSEKEKTLVNEIADLKAEIAKLKSSGTESGEAKSLAEQLKREKELKEKLAEKSNQLAASFKSNPSDSKSKTVASSSTRQSFFSAPKVTGPVATPSTVSTNVSAAPLTAPSSFRSGSLNTSGSLDTQAAAGVNNNRNSLSESGGLRLISSGEGILKVEGDGDPSSLSAENYAAIKAQLSGSASQVVVEFPDGRKFVYTENPETNELIQTPVQEAFSLADLKRFDEQIQHQDDPEARSPASVVDIPVIDTRPSQRWSDVLGILRESGATSR